MVREFAISPPLCRPSDGPERGGSGPGHTRVLTCAQASLAPLVAEQESHQSSCLSPDPFGQVAKPHLRPRRNTIRPWAADVAERFMAVAETDPLAARSCCCSSPAFGPARALGLPWSDIDLGAGTIHIRPQSGTSAENFSSGRPRPTRKILAILVALRTAAGRCTRSLPSLVLPAGLGPV